jgi:antitoxin (DNA-binding transcriptional repressor) of toxin-antitoxin stability system
MAAKTTEIADLLQDVSGVLETVRAGGSFLLITGGVPVARLVPLGATTIEDAIASGMASPAKISLAELLDGVAQGPVTTILSEVLGRMREDNRS